MWDLYNFLAQNRFYGIARLRESSKSPFFPSTDPNIRDTNLQIPPKWSSRWVESVAPALVAVSAKFLELWSKDKNFKLVAFWKKYFFYKTLLNCYWFMINWHSNSSRFIQCDQECLNPHQNEIVMILRNEMISSNIFFCRFSSENILNSLQ